MCFKSPNRSLAKKLFETHREDRSIEQIVRFTGFLYEIAKPPASYLGITLFTLYKIHLE